MFFDAFTENAKDIITAEDHQKLTKITDILNQDQPEQDDYTFFSLNVNITLNLQFKKMLDNIYYFIASPYIFLLSSTDFSQLSTIIQKRYAVTNQNSLSRYVNILEQITNFHNHSIENQAEYAYKHATIIASSEEFQQLIDIIPSENSIKEQTEDQNNPLNSALYILGRDDIKTTTNAYFTT